jgi:thiamine biosynthesis lipoprotein
MLLKKLNNKPKPKQFQRQSPTTFRFEAIGTQWFIAIDTPISLSVRAKLRRDTLQRITRFDTDYSRFRPDSLITSMAQAAGTYRLPADAEPLLNLYRELYALTGGLMTPLVGQLVSDLGYDAYYSLALKETHTVPAWDSALAYNYPLLTLKRPALLDFGAAGKGYLIDIVAELLVDAGVSNFTVNAGGDILVRTNQNSAEQIALEHPDDLSSAIGIAELRNQSICGSAGNRRAWNGYHHIINPKTRQSENRVRAVWVVADSTLLADGLSTALFFVNPEVLLQRYVFEYAIMLADNSLNYSSSFPAAFFTHREPSSR